MASWLNIKQNETTSALHGPQEVEWRSLHSPAQMFWNFPLLKPQKDGLAKLFSLAGDWLTQILKKKKNTQKTLVLFWSTVALLKKEVLVPKIQSLLFSFRPVVFAILWASKTALVSSIIIYLRKESFLTDIQHFKNSLKSRRQSLFYHYSLLLLSQISSFLRFHIY